VCRASAAAQLLASDDASDCGIPLVDLAAGDVTCLVNANAVRTSSYCVGLTVVSSGWVSRLL
jgi:hypothetical protein